MIKPTNRIKETSAASYTPEPAYKQRKIPHHSLHSEMRSQDYSTRVAAANTRPVVEMNPGTDQSSPAPGVTAQTGLGG